MDEHSEQRGVLDGWLTVPQVAAQLKLSATTVYALIKRGEIPAARVGKRKLWVDPKDLRTWVESRRVPTEREAASPPAPPAQPTQEKEKP